MSTKAIRCKETGEVFPSVAAVAAHLHVVASTVSSHLRGRILSAGGCHLEYVNPEDDEGRKTRGDSGANICFDCQNAVPSKKRGTGCPWSRAFKPVPGWTATPCVIDRGGIETYRITACPQFKEG